MSADRFPAALALVLVYEGGYSDDAHDPGGPTCLGITQETLSAWRGHPCAAAEVRELRRQDVEPIYRSQYWVPVAGDSLHAGVDLMMFDGAVNQGVEAMVHMLQGAVGVLVDGILGPATVKAAVEAHPLSLIESLRLARLKRYRADPNFERYKTDWMRRLGGVSATATSWATKAIA